MLFYTIVIIILLLVYLYKFTGRVGTKLTEQTTVLITGGCMGIGKEICQLLEIKHVKLVIVDIREDLYKPFNTACHFYKCDLNNLQEVSKVFTKILQEHTIDVLINNAGIVITKMFKETSFDELILQNNVDYLAPAIICKLLIPHMESNGSGHIVNVASVLSVLHGFKVAPYVAAKHSLMGLHECIRLESSYYKSPIKFSIVTPWAIDTGMFHGFKSKLDFLMPMLKPKYVAQSIVKGIESGKEIICIEPYYLPLSYILKLFPAYIQDRLAILIQGPYINQLKGRQ